MFSPTFIGGAASGAGVTFAVCVFLPGVLRKIKAAFVKKTTTAKNAVAGAVNTTASKVAGSVESAASKAASEIKKV